MPHPPFVAAIEFEGFGAVDEKCASIDCKLQGFFTFTLIAKSKFCNLTVTNISFHLPYFLSPPHISEKKPMCLISKTDQIN